MMFRRSVSAAACAAVFTAGCGTVAKVRDEIEQQQPAARSAMSTPVQLAPQSRVTVVKGAMLPVSEVSTAKSSTWLKSIVVSIDASGRTPMTLSQVVSQLAGKGLNVTSDLPLDSFTFSGTVNSTDAESALRLILGSVGLDYQADDARRLVYIKPMASRTWYINLGNRQSSYSSNGTTTSNNDTAGGSSNNSNGSSNNGSQSQQGGQFGASSSSSNSQNSASGNSGSNSQSGQSGGSSNGQQLSNGNTNYTGVSSADNFWQSLANELNRRLSVMVPSSRAQQARQMESGLPPLPALPGVNGPTQAPFMPTMPQVAALPTSTNGSSTELYVSKQVGTYALNPETGAITVQAPHWILNDLNQYMKRVQEMYNTELTFTGELVLVTSNRDDSEGFDIQSFAKFANGRYGAVVSNNGLGGVTVSFPGSGLIPSVAAGAQTVSGGLLGIVSKLDGVQIFNAYLEDLGKVAVLQRPVLTTNSGVPGEFEKITPKYYNLVSQQAASAGTGSAVQATTNTLVQKDFGTQLRINPRYDFSTGLIRAQISMKNVIPAGSQTIPQTINTGSGSQTVLSTIPLDTRLNISGEALMRDGDLIIVGGQTEDSQQTSENGLPTSGAPISGVFGRKNATTNRGTYYFALQVKVNRR